MSKIVQIYYQLQLAYKLKKLLNIRYLPKEGMNL